MNRKFALAVAVAASVAGNAYADDITVDRTPFVSTLSRGEVQTQLRQFKKARTYPWSTQYYPVAAVSSSRTRAQAVDEFIAARGEVAAFAGEDSGSAYLARNGGGLIDARRMAGQTHNAQ